MSEEKFSPNQHLHYQSITSKIWPDRYFSNSRFDDDGDGDGDDNDNKINKILIHQNNKHI